MWSGPRNISTAMMRAWENRTDTQVIDEPLYGQYLHHTQIEHPGAQEVIAAQGSSWQEGVKRCFVPLQKGQSIHYQKHMTMHLLEHIDRSWVAELTNCFLIRHPAEVVASYSVVREAPTLYDIGFVQQAALYDYVRNLPNQPCLVIDSAEFLSQPKVILPKICSALDIEFDENMLSWPTGSRDTDGVWSPYWYDSVNQSTSFAPYKPKELDLDQAAQNIVEQALPYYERLYSNIIQ